MFPLQGIICNVRVTRAFRSYLHRDNCKLKKKKNSYTADYFENICIRKPTI